MTTSQGFSSYARSIGLTITGALILFAFSGIAFADSNSGLGVEVNIGHNGGALVRGAKVTSVSSTTVNANTSWGSNVLNWIVKTDSNTEIVNKNGRDSSINEVAVGDIISFRGALDQTVSGFTVKAKVLKDWSKTEARTKISGTVASINATLGSFTLVNGNATTSVQTSSTTSFKKNGSSAAFSDIVLNAKVKLSGMFNASSSIFTATGVEIGENNNASWDHDDRKEWRHWVKSKAWLNWNR